uniref:Uncharacterized protein n=1 Tax=Tanacetum cinerariifolium TaxID=118510 RepID=A0A6L2JEL7_TANCI|nr:hypothetical protein [Tanacetum cinerariifolium]
MCYVDGIKCHYNIVCRRRPPTKVWTAELLSEREAVELTCRGFEHGELEEHFIDEEGDLIPNNIENITKERKGFEKMLTAAEHMFPGNVNLIGFVNKYINSLKCSAGGNNSRTNATMPDTQEKEKDVQGEAGYPNMNRVEALNEEVKVGVGDIGVNEQTPGYGKDLMGVTKNRFVDVGHDAESLFGFDRQENMCVVLIQKAFESVADEVEWSIEKSKIMEIDDRPSFSFGVTQDFDVIPVTKNENKVLTPMLISVYTPEGETSDVFMFYGKRVTTKSNIMRSPFYSRVADVDDALSSEESKVFLPVDNEGHRFLLNFDLKYGVVTVFDQKKKDKILKKIKLKKGAKIGKSIVAEMLHADFGRYLFGLDHIKSRNIITAELEIGEYDWQTAMEQVKAHMEHASESMLSDFQLGKMIGQDKMNETLM